MKIRLTHTSHMPGAEGMPGETINVKDGVGRLMLKRKGAVAVESGTKPVETTSIAPAEQAARTERPKGR